MQPSNYIPFIVIFIILYVMFRNRKAIVARKTIQKRKPEGNKEMIELAKRFIGKDCLIYAFDSNHQVSGVIKEVSNSAILVQNGETLEAVNLDFVIRIREYPKNKQGKKMTIVID